MKNLIVASTSTIHGGSYLEYLTDEVTLLFKDCKEIIFIPYARPGGMSHDAYTEIAAKFFKKIYIKVTGLHTYDNPAKAIKEAKGVFTGGGNTFLLVHMLYRNEVLQPLRESIYNGLPYLGTSAGSNICGPSMQTTNDMPIVYPPSFKTLGVIPYNINAHYLDPDPSSKHMGETRETRIEEFHTQNTIPVIGLREGSWLRVIGDEITLKGAHTARMFEQGKLPLEIVSGAV
jgi:dipeptidase E